MTVSQGIKNSPFLIYPSIFNLTLSKIMAYFLTYPAVKVEPIISITFQMF